ncbi:MULTISPECIES: hypothetical protein [unclassified Mucilaginibacter]|uniref:hypothetical protein n=1 Tax=unclassified Mucilaginibacter TaxID=2617802 RepID=UPI0031F6FC85
MQYIKRIDVRAKAFTYGIIFCLLIGILESNGIRVLSVFGKSVNTTKQADDKSAEDPVKESENFRVETIKPWLHHTVIYNFNEPVFSLPVSQPIGYLAKLWYSFCPDVLTPPPNC